jgi:hypothetical protein
MLIKITSHLLIKAEVSFGSFLLIFLSWTEIPVKLLINLWFIAILWMAQTMKNAPLRLK